MSVFICWSGDRSHKLADEIKKLLKGVFPKLSDDDIFVSDKIEKGVNWFESVVTALGKSRAGIVCLTTENLDSPWMHFEAGALASGLAGLTSRSARAEATAETDARRQQLFTILHGVSGAEIKGPLGAFQGTTPTRAEMEQMIRSLGQLLGAEHVKTLDRRAKALDRRARVIPTKAWDDFEKTLRAISVPARDLIADLEKLFQRKTFNEPLHRCSDLAWIRRYDGARVTKDTLETHLQRVKAACKPHERQLFELLISELDGYAMTIQSLLLTPRVFDLNDEGELNVDAGIRTCCEDRRLAIRSLSGRLLHPLDDPLREEAVRFMAAETHEERKMIVHRIEGAVRKQRELVFEKSTTREPATTERALKRLCGKQKPVEFRSSSWDLDRIYFYLLVQYFDVDALRWSDDESRGAVTDRDQLMEHDWLCATRDVEMEIERYRAKAKGRSLTPLTYALCALVALHPERKLDNVRVQTAVEAAVSAVRKELGAVLESETGVPIKRLLTALELAPRRRRPTGAEVTPGPRRKGSRILRTA